MTNSIYSFVRTELRVLQHTCADNEEFLNTLADMIGKRDQEIEELKYQLANLRTVI